MFQIAEQSDEEKLAMYLKLSKKELAIMLIQANKTINGLAPLPIYVNKTEVPYFETCHCNPKNGGSGICGCTLGNKITYK